MKIINKAIEILKNGGVILYPTDTVWGIGCDATNEKAVEKIYQIKKRDESKALITLVGSCNQLLDYTKIKSKEAKNSSPTTIIYPNVSGLAKNLLANDKSAAIRIVQNELCKKLILKFNKAIVSTSANISGYDFPKRFSEINTKIIEQVDYIIDSNNDSLLLEPSKIFKVNLKGKVTETIR
tara:strand:- start:56527 stop:57069 length:543 start_codon:yes stop_codon:yes gene_type:complete